MMNYAIMLRKQILQNLRFNLPMHKNEDKQREDQ